MTLVINEPMPVTIIGGYLGSGKTTLVNHLLRHAKGVRLAVMVNDFGELPIDANLIEAQDGDVISLSGGCVCCSYGDDLSSAMMKLQSNLERPEHIFIEASGVALPGAIGKTLALNRAFRLEGVVVLADASTVMENARDKYVGDTIQRQLRDADLIILNKLDLLHANEADSVRQGISEHNACAPQIDALHSQLDPEVFFQVRHSDVSDQQSKNETDHLHDASMFTTFHITIAYPVDARLTAERLADKQCALIRAKGFVLDMDGLVKTIQIVGRRWSVTVAPDDSQPGLVCIGFSGVVSEALVMSVCFSSNSVECIETSAE